MSLSRAATAALLTILAYTFSLVALAPAAQPNTFTAYVAGVGEVRADASSDACSPKYQTGSANFKACVNGYNNALAGTGTQTEADKSHPDAYEFGAQRAEASTTKDNYDLDQDKCNASIKSIGWLACPLFDDVIQFVTGVAKGLMSQFLAVQPLELSGPIYQTWQGVRLLANVGFVLIFLVIIFAHVLDYNLDSYGLKKMLPKLAAAAILVQFSYILSSLIVDVGNVLGAGVGSLISSVTNGGHPTGISPGSVAENIINLLIGGVVAAGLVSIALTGLVLAGPIFIIVLIGILAFVTTLAFRYFLIGILIVASPLALVAWVLPNTERYFNQWLSVFIKLILMYPIIIALLSVAGNVGGLIPATTEAPGAIGQAGQSITTTVIKVLVVAGCFMFIPRTFQWAGGMMNEVNERMNDLSRKGAKAYWDSPGVGARRANVKGKQIKKADAIEEGFKHGQGKYAWLGRGRNSNALIRKARGGMYPIGMAMYTGQSADKATRQYSYGSLVEGHIKTVGVFDESKETHNLEDAMNVHLMERRISTGAYNNPAERAFLTNAAAAGRSRLEANDALFLMDFTGTAERREAILHHLGQRNMLKAPMQKHMQELAKATGDKTDLAAFIRQDFTNYGKQPGLAGINTAMDIKVPQVPEMLKNLTASRVASPDFSERNFEVAAKAGTEQALEQSASLAKHIAENMNNAAFRLNFKDNDRAMMAQQKQVLMLLTMARNEPSFSTGNGALIRQSIMNQIMEDMTNSNGATHRAVLDSFVETARSHGSTDAEIQHYINTLTNAATANQTNLNWHP